MEQEKKVINISITSGAIFKICLIFVLFYTLYIVRDILTILFVSLILSSALDPWVEKMQKRRIPRGLAMVVIYIILLGVLGVSVYLIIPPMVTQISELSNSLPMLNEKFSNGVNLFKGFSEQGDLLGKLQNNLGNLSSSLQDTASSIFSTITTIFGGILTFFFILVITFYMVVEENAIKKVIWSIAPTKHQVYIMHLVNRMQKKIGLWLRGQLILCLIVFLLTYFALTLHGWIMGGGLGQYALVLALIAGLAEAVAYLGPMLAAIPAIILALSQSWTTAIVIALIYYGIQWTENNILVPRVMQRIVGLNPIISIAVLMIGFQVAGVIGAIFSIPVATAASVVIKDLLENRQNEQEE